MNVIVAIIQLLPILVKLVTALEAAFPESGAGKAKLEAARQILVAADSTTEAMWPVLSTAISAVVSVMNATKAKAA